MSSASEKLVDDSLGAVGDPWLRIGRHELRSRLIIGVEQYKSPETIALVLNAGGAELFITTYDLGNTRSSLLLADLDRAVNLHSYIQIGTTSFALSADEAVETALRLRENFGIDIIKLDVRDKSNMPDAAATIIAATRLLKEEFTLLPFIPPDSKVAIKLAEMGCVAIRLLAAPVASYRGICDPHAMRKCIEQLHVPVILEGGIGSPAHVATAFELGASAVLVNTLIAQAHDPARMAAAMRHATLAGWLAAEAR